MGQAKLRQRRERDSLLRVFDDWSHPPSEWEAAMVREVKQLPTVLVSRVPPERLAQMRMKPRLCHDNCHWYAEHDPSGATRACSGWLSDGGGTFVLHSVIASGDDYLCITPMPHVGGTHFEFKPDSAITVTRTDDGAFEHRRNGQLIGAGLRIDPAKTLAQIARVRERVAAGMDPVEAVRLG
jgi:hypothetical protein